MTPSEFDFSATSSLLRLATGLLRALQTSDRVRIWSKATNSEILLAAFPAVHASSNVLAMVDITLRLDVRL